MSRISNIVFVLSVSFLSACKLNSPMPPPAPVLERPIQSSPGLSPTKASATEPNVTKATALADHQYQVQKGDTLYAISKKVGLPLAKLAELNQLMPPFALQVGQVLTIAAKTTSNQTAVNNSNNEDAEVVTAAISQPPALGNDKAAAVTVAPEATPSTPTPTASAINNASTNVNTDLDRLNDAALVWQWPLQGKVTTQFDGQTSKGINITGNAAQGVAVASAGKVIYSGIDIRGYGKLVIVKHNSNLLSVYAHHGVSLVKEGAFVAANDIIATLPATQNPPPVLHFEIRQKGKPVDPMTFLPAVIQAENK